MHERYWRNRPELPGAQGESHDHGCWQHGIHPGEEPANMETCTLRRSACRSEMGNKR